MESSEDCYETVELGVNDTKMYTNSHYQPMIHLVPSHLVIDFIMLESVQSSHQGHSYTFIT